MDDLDDMECKSAASWNPKFDFHVSGGKERIKSSELPIQLVN